MHNEHSVGLQSHTQQQQSDQSGSLGGASMLSVLRGVADVAPQRSKDPTSRHALTLHAEQSIPRDVFQQCLLSPNRLPFYHIIVRYTANKVA